MRGTDFSQNALFVTVTVEDFVPSDHPLRARTAEGNIPPGNRGGEGREFVGKKELVANKEVFSTACWRFP